MNPPKRLAAVSGQPDEKKKEKLFVCFELKADGSSPRASSPTFATSFAH
jgi:hypothetical protein